MGLEGLSNNASGGMSPGEHLYAKTFNKLATSADKAQVGPSEGVIYTANNGGIGLFIAQPPPGEGGIIQQFQIFVEPYEVGGNTEAFSIIRVVKGEVVWTPNLATENPLPTNTCTTQTTIENWFALPTFPIIDDENSVFIGDGGIRVPNTTGLEVGIFIFKANGIAVDVPPIIVAAPNYTPACPVVFPGTPPVASAVWEVVQIGSAKYEIPEGSEEGTNPQWVITQKFIGSLTLPGKGGQGGGETTSLLPGQLVTQISEESRSPFECVITQVNGERYLRIVNGTISYSTSNMPLIKSGAFTHTKQAWATKVQICPSGMRTENIYPSPFDPDPQFNNYWMENEGGYKLSDTNDPIVLYAFKWDVDTDVPPFMNNAVVNTGLPTLAILAQSNATDTAKITKDSGPSIYDQTMNIQRMSGYLPEDTGLVGEWGHSHTTWLNPRKIGYNYKAIATLIANTNSFSCIVSIEQAGIQNVQNSVQTIRLIGDAKEGDISFSFTWNGVTGTSSIPFPVTDIYTQFSVESSDELALLRCLNSIPSLTGNVQVSRSDKGTYHVTFINELQGQVVPALVANADNVTAFDYRFDIIQYHTGNLDLTIPMQFGMTQLMNKDDVNESEDPYNLNKDSDPAWKDICNKDDVINCDNFSGDVTDEGMFNMSNYTDNNPDFTLTPEPDSCTHPFEVKRISFVAEEFGEFKVCSGMVNNVIPGNTEDTFTLLNGYIYLAVYYDRTNKIFPGVVTISSTEDEVPDSTIDISFIAIARIVDGSVEQLVTGSLWGDRIQTGFGEGEKAYYYYAQV